MRRFLFWSTSTLALIAIGLIAGIALRDAAPPKPSAAYQQGWNEAAQGIFRQADECGNSTAYLPSAVEGSNSSYIASERADFFAGCVAFFKAH